MPASAKLVIHSARAIDARGAQDNAWLAIDDSGRIMQRGEGGSWRGLRPQSQLDAAGAALSPGFVDMHCHGGNGVSFDGTAEQAERALYFHAQSGSTSVVASLVSAPLAKLESQLAALARLTHPALIGSHLEGPFLAESHRGAHDPDVLIGPTEANVASLLAAAAGTLTQLTLAPELPGSSAAIRQLVAADVRVAIGHTAADYEASLAAFAAGASILTHTFNGMPGLHHRAPGPAAAALASPSVTLELILDGVHVHDQMSRLLFALAPDRVALVSDAMVATGCADGEFQLGAIAVTVRDGVARVRGGSSIAGSTITVASAVRHAIVQLGLPAPRAIGAATHIPARALGLSDRGLLEPGYRADLVLLDADWRVQQVWLAGAAMPAVAA